MEEIKLQTKSNEFYTQARFFLDINQYEEALQLFEDALRIFPANDNAMVGKAYSLKRLGKVQEAWELMDKLITQKPDFHKAWYNRACYGTLLGHDKEKILYDLSKAIEFFPGNKLLSKNDPDFKSFFDDPDFTKITQ